MVATGHAVNALKPTSSSPFYTMPQALSDTFIVCRNQNSRHSRDGWQGQRSRSKESMIDESQAKIGSRDQVIGPLHCHLTTKSQPGSPLAADLSHCQ